MKFILIFIFIFLVAVGIFFSQASSQEELEEVTKTAHVIPIAKYRWSQIGIQGFTWGARICGIVTAAVTIGDFIIEIFGEEAQGWLIKTGIEEMLDIDQLGSPNYVVICFVYSRNLDHQMGNKNVLFLFEYSTEIPLGLPLTLTYIEKNIEGTSTVTSPQIGVPISFSEDSSFYDEESYLTVEEAWNKMRPIIPVIEEDFNFSTVGVVDSYTEFEDEVFMILKQYSPFSYLFGESIWMRFVPVMITNRGQYPTIGSVVFVRGMAKRLPENQIIHQEYKDLYSEDTVQYVDISHLELLEGQETPFYTMNHHLLDLHYESDVGEVVSIRWPMIDEGNSQDSGDYKLPPMAWSSNIQVSNSPGTQSNWPRVEATGDTVYVVWAEGTAAPFNLYFNRSFDAGNSWDIPQLLTANARYNYALVADGDIVIVFWETSSGAQEVIQYVRSADAGAVWSPAENFSSPAEDVYCLEADANEGRIVCFWSEVSGSSGWAKMSLSNDDGQTWGSTLDVATFSYNPTYGSFVDGTIAGSVLIVAIHEGLPANIKTVRSLDWGQTWSAPVTVDSDPTYGFRTVKIDASGNNAVIRWGKHYGAYNDEAYVAASADAGITWSVPTVTSIPSSGGNSTGDVCISGTRAVVMWINNPGTGPLQPYYSRSVDGGQTWEVATLIPMSGISRFDVPRCTATGSRVYITGYSTEAGHDIWLFRGEDPVSPEDITFQDDFEDETTTETIPEVEWDKTFGGSDNEGASSVQQTSDGGYIVAGATLSYGAGGSDFWLIKTDANGNKEWDKTFGGFKWDSASSVQQTSDGGYIVAGDIYSYGAGKNDFWLVKTDANGNKEWDKTFGGSDYDIARSIQQTSDGGYIVAGSTSSYEAGESYFWLIKTDVNGNKEWDKTFGRLGSDDAYSVQQTSDGGYIVAGDIYSYGAYGAGVSDFWLVKTDANGNKEWDKTFGGSNNDYARSVQQTSDGGYIVVGSTSSYGVGGNDSWLIKTDANGNKEWDKTFGSSDNDFAQSIQQTSDGGYIIAGGRVFPGVGNLDLWLIKLKGNKEQHPQDETTPYTYNLNPLQNSINIDSNTNIYFEIKDTVKINRNSLEMFVNGAKVEPIITPIENGFSLQYDPPVDFAYGQKVTVRINATDINGNTLSEEYSFTIRQAESEIKTVEWLHSNVPSQVGKRKDHSAIYDSSNKRMLVFGGHTPNGDLFEDLWEYKTYLESWSQISVSGRSPRARNGHSAIYDPENRKMLIFGGEGEYHMYYDDLWGFDCQSNTWTSLAAIEGPSGRDNHTAIYDFDRKKMLIFGGHNYDDGYNYYLNDLWEYDIESNSWKQLTPSGNPPTGRAYHTAVYDPSNKRMLVFGGRSLDMSSMLNDLWEYDIASNNWTQLASSTPPIARENHTALFDPFGNRMLVFGGDYYDDRFHYLDDLWEFNISNNTWSQLTSCPKTMTEHTAVINTSNRDMMIYSGFDLYSVNLGEPVSDSITGIVTDATTSQFILDALIEIIHGETVISSAYTSEAGVYSISNLPEGTYSVRGSKDGFETILMDDVVVTLGQATELNLEMNQSFRIVSVDIMPEHYETNELFLIIKLNFLSDKINRIICFINSQDDTIKTEVTKGSESVLLKLRDLPSILDDIGLNIQITEIDDKPFKIEASKNISMYYALNYEKEPRPFSVKLDGYKFPNSPFQWRNFDDFLTTFTASSQIFGLSPPFFVASIFLQSGRCWGMAATSIFYFIDPKFKPFEVRKKETGEMEKSEPGVLDAIIRYHLSQYPKLVQKETPMDVNANVEGIQEALLHNKPVILDMVNEENGSRHSTVGYKMIFDHSKQIVFVNMYDSNEYKTEVKEFDIITVYEPSEPRVCKFDLNDQTFLYQTPSSSKYTKAFIYVPQRVMTDSETALYLSNYTNESIKILCEKKISVHAIACPATMLLTDDSGRRVGFIGGESKVNEIPNAQIIVIPDGAGGNLSVYYVPSDLDYTVEYFGQDKGMMDVQILIPKSEEEIKSVSFWNIPISQSTKAILEVNGKSNFSLNLDSDRDGTIDMNLFPSYMSTVDVTALTTAPTSYLLSQNYPNPLSRTPTTIEFELPNDGYIRLVIYNIIGQKVKTLINDIKPAGHYSITWDGNDESGMNVAEGIYLYSLKIGYRSVTKKMLLIR